MGLTLTKGRYGARQAEIPADVAAAQALRHRAFHRCDGHDADPFDEICTHILIEEVDTGRLVACFRILPLTGGGEIGRSYSAQYYGLTALEAYAGRMVEIGRFCSEPGLKDPDILRVAWGAMTAYVDENAVKMLFGCSSFAGTDAAAYQDSFAMLRERHLAPRRWWPQVKAPQVVRFGRMRRDAPDTRAAMGRMPPLLRTYLMMGGWVSDHAVIDAQMNTLHVFTGLEIGRIPETRKRLLRAVAAG